MPSTTVEIKAKDKTSAAFNAVSKSIAGLKTGVLAIGAAVAGATAAFGAWFNKMRDTADRIGKVSSQLNITAESLQRLRFAAGQGGVDMGKFDKALQKFAQSTSKALEGSVKQAEAFERLNIKLKDTEGNTKSLDTLFLEVARRFELLGESARSAGIATDLFGGAGVELLPMLRSGSEGIKLLGDRVENFGGVITGKGVKATEEFNDNLDLLTRKFRDKFTPIIAIANEALAQFTEEERLATMTLPQMRDHIQEQIDALAKQRDALKGSKEESEGWVSTLLKGARGSVVSKEGIQKQINALIQNRNEIDKQVGALDKQYQAEKKALEQSMATVDARKKTAEVNKLVSDSNYEVNDSLLAQGQIQEGQFETFEEIMVQKQAMAEQDVMLHQEWLAREEIRQSKQDAAFIKRINLANKEAKAKKKIEAESLKSSLGTIESLASGVKDSSIEMFRLWQAAAIANTTISTLEAATKALTAGPYIGPVLAGVIYALGMANVAKIASTNYQGKYLGGDVQAGKPYLVGERGPELFQPGQTGSIVPNKNLTKSTVVNVNISAVDAAGIDELLTRRKALLVSLINQSLNRSVRAPI